MFKKIAKSKYTDFVGLIIVVLCAYFQGYIFENLQTVTHWGAWSSLIPFGIISTLASMISIESDRLTARLNNLGNWIGLIAVVTSGTIDYLLGNKAAPLTFLITFIIQGWAIKTWKDSKQFQANTPLKGAKAIIAYVSITVFALAFSYFTNTLGFQGTRNGIFYWTVIVFAMSLIANLLNAFKLTAQWPFWLVYNFSQLFKSILQGNWSNVGKYIYYLFNSVAGIFLWTKSTGKNEKIMKARV